MQLGGKMLSWLLWTPGFHPWQIKDMSKRVGRKKEGRKCEIVFYHNDRKKKKRGGLERMWQLRAMEDKPS